MSRLILIDSDWKFTSDSFGFILIEVSDWVGLIFKRFSRNEIQNVFWIGFWLIRIGSDTNIGIIRNRWIPIRNFRLGHFSFRWIKCIEPIILLQIVTRPRALKVIFCTLTREKGRLREKETSMWIRMIVYMGRDCLITYNFWTMRKTYGAFPSTWIDSLFSDILRNTAAG